MEVKEVHCMNYLVRVLGMLDENIEKDFKAIDENGDGLVSKEEGFKAYENIVLERGPTDGGISLDPNNLKNTFTSVGFLDIHNGFSG